MPKKNSYITITDQFCGAGGSSQGARNYGRSIGGGVEVKLALNHWKLAIETHNTNFPDTDHDCTDISASDPRRYCSTDILITSPECTNHTNGNGKKKPTKQTELFTKAIIDPSAERSRATMWDVPRFAEYHSYNLIIVENVVEARKWVMFESWIHAMHSIGYDHKCVYLNSMFCHPTPQSRDRMYVVFWKKGNKAPDLNYTPLAYCEKCEKDIHSIQSWKKKNERFGKYNKQYVYCCPVHGDIVKPYYYAAFNCIDWSIPGRRIGDIKPKIVDNTLRRIEVGRKRFWLSEYPYNASPFIIKNEYTKASDPSYVRSIFDSLLTQSTRQTSGICFNPMMPFIVENKGQSSSRGIERAISTFTTKEYHGIFSPQKLTSYLSYYNGSSDVCSAITSPVGTFTGIDRVALSYYEREKVPDIQDCYYRTIKSHEVQLGMGFDSTYKVLGGSKDRVKQLGNAVTPPAMEWLVGQCIKSLS